LIIILPYYKNEIRELLKVMQEIQEAQIGSLASQREAIQDKMGAKLKEIIEDMRTWQKEMKS
jgi:hypothetical protein